MSVGVSMSITPASTKAPCGLEARDVVLVADERPSQAMDRSTGPADLPRVMQSQQQDAHRPHPAFAFGLAP